MSGELWAVAAIVIALAGGLLFYRIRKGAQDGVRADAAEDIVKDATDANQIRDRLRSDAEYAQRVRERFTR